MRTRLESDLSMLMLYEHLLNPELIEKYPSMLYLFSDDKKNVILGNGNGKFYVIFPFVVYELPHIFTEFHEDAEGYVRYLPARKLDIYYALMEHLAITVDAFLHLFSVGTQNVTKFGGRTLTVDATCGDVAYNIQCYVEYVMTERSLSRNALGTELQSYTKRTIDI